MNDTAPLAGQTALITGAARRVGAAIARRLHAAGATVVIHCHHSAAEARQLALELNTGRPASASVQRSDLLDSDGLPQLIAAVLQRHQALNLLVNNASSFYPTRFGSITATQWADLMGTNLKAPLFLSQAAAAALRRTRGQIINIVDIHGLRPLRDYSVYSIAKAGLIQLTRALARELAPEVRVNAIAPGPVLWAEGPNALDPSRQQQIIERTLLKRAGSPADIAEAAMYFATSAQYSTGQTLAVDGGRSVGWS